MKCGGSQWAHAFVYAMGLSLFGCGVADGGTQEFASGADEAETASSVAGDPIGSLEQAALTPVPGCVDGVFNGHDYRYCPAFVPWSVARSTCQSYGLDLVRIESAAENDFVNLFGTIFLPKWIGANDISQENTWAWSADNVPFFQGTGIFGVPLNGSFEAFPPWEPVPDGSALDCANVRPFTGGAWFTTHCLEFSTIVCETFDQCPFDPGKTAPGACGCNQAETNTDGDAAPDCIDECPEDPAKTEAGITGCGVPETDTDGDGVPPPFDEDPNDPTIQDAGKCGTSTSPAPAGTPCTDGPCPGTFTCDGAGHCGTPSCPPPGGGACVHRMFQGKTYWFCPGPASWAEAGEACRDRDDQSLARVETSVENAFISNVLTSDAWLGASDLSADGDWRWATFEDDAGPRFWSGGATGTTYGGSFESWAASQPSAGTGEACASMSGSASTWDDRSCGNAIGFVCEATTGPETPPIVLDCPAQLFGLPCPVEEQCVDEASQFPEFDLSTPEARSAAAVIVDQQGTVCTAACQDGTDETACRQACEGGIFDPPTGNTCTGWEEHETQFCQLASAPEPLVGCMSDASCAAGLRCGYLRGPGTPSASAPIPTDRVCGVPTESCPDPNEPELPDCDEGPLMCADPDHTQVVADWDDPGELAPIDFDPEEHFPENPAPPPDQPYLAGTQTPCPGGACQLATAHPWCTYAPIQGLDAPPSVTDDRAARAGGSQPLISFDFDPQLNLHFGAEIGPLGLPNVDLTAEAGLSAGAHVSGEVVSGGVDVPIVHVMASIRGTECEIDTSATAVQLLGIDFVPPNSPGEETPHRESCEDAYADFTEAANRANKALRDAQALIAQYYEAIDAGTPLGNICTQLFPTGVLPPGFPPPTEACASEPPAKTITRFVEYYNRTVKGFPAFNPTSLAQAGALFRTLTAPGSQFDQEFALFQITPSTEELTLANAQFFIGPIPVNLEVYAALQYAVDVNARFTLNAGQFLSQSLLSPNPTGPSDVGFVGVGGSPYATALLGVFAGVGFDLPGVSAKFGVDAQLSLATLNLPAHAGAGLALSTQPDPRAAPTDLADPVLVAAGNPSAFLVPPKRYVASVRYAMGLSAVVSNVLHGAVNARLKLKFFFFSKTWRKRLFGFSGFCAGGCDPYKLFENEGTLGQPASFRWDEVRMPTPFPVLVSPEFFSTGTLPVGTGTLDVSQVEKFFYDSLCQCIETDSTERPCYRSEDCCEFDPAVSNGVTCFSHPALATEFPDLAGGGQCRACGGSGELCNNDEDCCGSNICRASGRCGQPDPR